MKERRERRGENLGSREKNASIHKQGMQFVQSTTQIVQFSSGNKAFLNISSFFFSLPFLWSSNIIQNIQLLNFVKSLTEASEKHLNQH